jgi:hypothetical protein
MALIWRKSYTPIGLAYRKYYTPPACGVDPGAPRTLFEFFYYGPAQFGGCAFSFFVLFFCFFFILL